jgi:hypothetical protein
LGICAAAALAVLASSCGDGTVRVYPVQGKVVDEKGKPAAGAQVFFHPSSPPGGNVEAVVGTTDANGIYRLTTYTAGDGAPAGQYVVTVCWYEPKKSPFGPPPKDILCGKYASREGSHFKFTVEPKADNEMPLITVRIPK